MARPTREHCRLAIAILVAGTLGLTTGVGVLPTPATASGGGADHHAAATEQPSRSEAYDSFNDPHGTWPYRQDIKLTEENVIGNTEGPTVDKSRPPGLIQFTGFDFSDMDVAEKLVKNAQGGNHVEVLLDGASIQRRGCQDRSVPCANPAVSELEKLNDSSDPWTWLRTCAGVAPGHPYPIAGAGNGCLAPGLDHNKFILTSAVQLQGDEYGGTVLITSSNNTAGMYRHAYNDAVVLANEPGVYNYYERYFQQLATASGSPTPSTAPGRPAQPAHSRLSASIRDHSIEAWTFPEPANQDPVPGIFRRVSVHHGCRNPVSSSLGPSRTQIDIAMDRIHARTSVVRALARLRDRHCAVSIVYRRLSAQDRKILTHAHVRLHQLCTAAGDYLHSKFFLINGTTRSVGHNRRLVYTGSENWTAKALTQADDNLLQYGEAAGNSPVYDGYAARFQKLLQLSRKPARHGTGCTR